jgi:hypothetical protein
MIGLCKTCRNYIIIKVKYIKVYDSGNNSGIYKSNKECCIYGLDLFTNCGKIEIKECNHYKLNGMHI